MKTKAEKQADREKSIKFLKTFLKPGSTVYTVLRKVSSSGMSRHISVLVARKKRAYEGQPVKPVIRDIGWHVANVTGFTLNDNHSLKVGGCGMDMGFHVVYSLGRALYPKGFKLRKGQYGRNGDKSGYDTNGGYALNQQWI
jgi:hypothetical protein